MKPWMADYVVESELILIPDEKRLEIKHPEGLYTLHLRPPAKDTDGPHFLSCQIFVNAPDIAAAEQLTDERLRHALHLVSFVTCCSIRVSRRVVLIDWTPGVLMREAYVYGGHGLGRVLINASGSNVRFRGVKRTS
jgi:hypothetical protein